MRKYISKPDIKIFSYCLFTAFIFLLICTKSSPLYPINDWVDPNCFFTVGRGMINGKVIYRDLFEQKGPLLYFIHGLAALISDKSFFGVFILQVISFSFFLYFSHKIITIYLKKNYSYIILPIITYIILVSDAFVAGDSAEEFILPLITISLYGILKYFKNIYPKPINSRVLVLNGFIAGCVLWIKYTMLGFWFAWMMVIFIAYIVNKHYTKAFISCLQFVLGMIIATIPWIIYFGINNAIGDWIYAYFTVNIFMYPLKLTFIARCKFIYLSLREGILANKLITGFCGIGLIVFLFSKNCIETIMGKIALLVCGVFLVLGVYGGGNAHRYYFLIFAAFCILAPICVGIFIEKYFRFKVFKKYAVLFAVPLLLGLVTLSYFRSANTNMLGRKKVETVQYKFASIINQTSNASMLNYGSLDGGFYLAANSVPKSKFFCKLNLLYESFPQMMDKQNQLIKDRKVDYVVCGVEKSQNITNIAIPYLFENYNKVSEEVVELYNGSISVRYLLYKLK